MTDTRDIVERPESPFNRPSLAERIAQAKVHMHGYRQHNEALWPHQPFCLTAGELLDAAEQGLKAAAEITRLRADLATSMETLAKAQALQAEMLKERAAIAQPAASGWQWVPVEPTADMRNAFHAVGDSAVLAFGNAGAHWKAMLAAAPQAPQPGAQGA